MKNSKFNCQLEGQLNHFIEAAVSHENEAVFPSKNESIDSIVKVSPWTSL